MLAADGEAHGGGAQYRDRRRGPDALPLPPEAWRPSTRCSRDSRRSARSTSPRARRWSSASSSKLNQAKRGPGGALTGRSRRRPSRRRSSTCPSAAADQGTAQAVPEEQGQEPEGDGQRAAADRADGRDRPREGDGVPGEVRGLAKAQGTTEGHVADIVAEAESKASKEAKALHHEAEEAPAQALSAREELKSKLGEAGSPSHEMTQSMEGIGQHKPYGQSSTPRRAGVGPSRPAPRGTSSNGRAWIPTPPR